MTTATESWLAGLPAWLAFLTITAGLVAAWAGLQTAGHAITRWWRKAGEQTEQLARLDPPVPLPEYAARQHASLAALIDIADSRDCGCRYFDEAGDRYDWIPCERHIDQLIKDLLA